MYSRKPDHRMIECCPWPLSSFSYAGLCSHSPLGEMVEGNFDLSAEQLETIAAEVKEKNCNDMTGYYKKQSARNPEHVKQRHAKARQCMKKNSLDKMIASQDRHTKRTKASKKYYCATCKVSCVKPGELAVHLAGERHLKGLRGQSRALSKSTGANFAVSPLLNLFF